MIFKETWQQVLDGTKTQTRRPVKPREELVNVEPGYLAVIKWHPTNISFEHSSRAWRVKWEVGKTYAVQPGRGKKAVGRIRILAISRERLQEITWQDAVAEGIPQYMKLGMPDSLEIYCTFWHLWNSLYRKPYRWEDNPEVWVLHIERVEQP